MKIPHTALTELRSLLGKGNVLTDEASLLLHAYDCSLSRTRPDLLLNIRREEDVAPAVKILSAYKIPFVPRAAATNHAGSCAALNGGAILNLAGLNRILQINTQEQFAVVQPGVITADLQNALNKLGFFYAPDPASERVCTLGGNLAQNASGARCMKYGGTPDHVLEADAVLPTGQTVHFSRDGGGPDFIGLLAGSEGTLGVITRLKVQILPLVKHVKTFLVTFPSLEDSVQTVTDLTARGIIPRCVEAMDQTTLQTVEDFSHAGYPADAQALLILELDGTPAQIVREEKELEEICRLNRAQQFLPAKTEAERNKLWLGRRAAYAAIARLAPNVMVGDGTVPRSELPRALKKVRQILQERNIRASLLFHAGDGNFHPHFIFDERNPADALRVKRALNEVLKACVDCGGTISGEHGVGVEKRADMAYQYDKPTLDLFARMKRAADPLNLANPLKIIPVNYAEKARPQAPVDKAVQTLAQRIRLRREAGVPGAVTGANTRLKTAAKETFSTRALTKIADIDLTNYTATVQTGITLDDLQHALSACGVYCALPGGKGTLGGAFSSGAYPHFYAHTLGLEALLPDGSLVRYGGKFMKNSAGYHLTRLFAGARGTLGIVTQLTFKIFATPVTVPAAENAPAKPNALWHALKHELDPNGLFPILPEDNHV
ncbi:MAG: FAD-linked oxidase C-terminal domain-containing protein [Elusimicrobia bacterium]|nr:FAD-linked oxidase C-terminal domain-containing protein [Elusimicrobiota bacterium]MDY6039527.1 FAD-linked oxidase C-terminal domain-containing protein [Elusimicrobiaceae bacterium]